MWVADLEEDARDLILLHLFGGLSPSSWAHVLPKPLPNPSTIFVASLNPILARSLISIALEPFVS